MSGRFAPSPTGALHLGNLRTAMIAWLSARSSGRGFLVRVEDLDRHQSSREHERRQLADLARLGLDWDGDVIRQGDRFALYDEIIADLAAKGLVYECFCTRREIRIEIEAAPHAPHLPPGSYPGTCRELDQAARERHRAEGRPPALRLRTDHESYTIPDRVHGEVGGVVDDFVLRRNDGTPAYNLAVVVDDELQGVTEVVRGDDLLPSTARHLHLQQLLGYRHPAYAHVPLVMADDGSRLAKRDGGVTLEGLAESGVGAGTVVAWIASTLGLADATGVRCGGRDHGGPIDAAALVARFDWAAFPKEPVPTPAVRGSSATGSGTVQN